MKKVKNLRMVKCAYCGRERVPVTKKGNMKPHVKMDGRPCLFVNVIERE